jgi:hypothetical protein
MHEVNGGEVAARIEFDPTFHGTPLSLLLPLIRRSCLQLARMRK